MKITIRFLITNYSNFNFVLTLLFLQTQLNNFVNVVIDFSFNKIIYNFKVRKVFTTLFVEQIVDLLAQRLKYRQKTVKVIAFVNVKTKIYYDARYTSLLLNVNNYAYLRLNHSYQLSSKLNKKLFQQRCKLFLIKKRVSKLAYEFNLSST